MTARSCRWTRVLPLPSVLLPLLLLVATTASAEPPVEPLRAWLRDQSKTPPGPLVLVTAAGQPETARLIDAGKDGYRVKTKAFELAFDWTKLGPEDLYRFCRPGMTEAPADVMAAYLRLGVSLGRAEEKGFQSLLYELRAKDATAAQEIEGLKPPERGEEKKNGDETSSAGGRPQSEGRGRISRETYLREARDWSLAALHQRLGPDYDYYHKDSNSKAAKPPTVHQPAEQTSKQPRNGQGMAWTVGGPVNANGGDFSSTHAQLFYLPDKPNDPGVDRISILDMAHNVFTYKPEPAWWGGSHPEPGVQTPAWKEAAGGALGAPVAMARGYGMWCNSAILLFSSGLMGSAGTCTSQNTYPCFAFPKTKAPTAVALTTRNEFALVTVWDLEKMKGQLAVFVLDSQHKDGLMGLYCWHDPKPGLPNPGGFTSYKLLGYVDLPGLSAPSAVCAYGSGWDQWLHSLDGKNVQPRELDAADPKVRQLFYDRKQWNYRWCSESGFAVVVSKSEDRVAFVDLRPLFAYYREMYFGAEASYKKTLDVGPGPKQWPPTFEAEPRQKPVVAAVQPTPLPAPTAVICSVGGDDPSVLVAFQEGKLGIYKAGALAAASPAQAGEIRCTGAVAVGRNPCALAHNKNAGWGAPQTLDSTFIVVSRGDRMIQWVRVGGGKGEVIRTLQDSRLVDPVHCEMADTHGTESHVITVCDFKGRKVVNYRFGPVIFHTNGGAKFPMGPGGKDEFECGGVMEFPGYPYRVCGTNVN
jgi:hypothetical protein